MAMVTGQQAVLRLLIGHRLKQAARRVLEAELKHLRLDSGCPAEKSAQAGGQAGRLARRLAESLVARLRDYAAGKVVDFSDVAVEGHADTHSPTANWPDEQARPVLPGPQGV